MKKNLIVGSLICALLMVFSVQANAALIVLGESTYFEYEGGEHGNKVRQLILDDVTNVVWFDFTRGATAFWNAERFADTLEVTFDGGIWEDWRLPTEAEFFSMANDPAAGLFNYILDKKYWLLEDGRVFDINQKIALSAGPHNYNAMAVQPHVVPIPGAVWLLGAGLVGIIGFRRRKP